MEISTRSSSIIFNLSYRGLADFIQPLNGIWLLPVTLLQLVTRLHEESVVRRVLRHISDLLPYFSCNPKASKMLFKVGNRHLSCTPSIVQCGNVFAASDSVMELWQGKSSSSCIYGFATIRPHER